MRIERESTCCIKGFAALCIVLHHIQNTVPLQGDILKVCSPILENFGSCNVVLFLTLAGYGAYFSCKKMGG